MADDVPLPEQTAAEPARPVRSRRSRFVRGAARRVAILFVAGIALVLAALVVLDSSLGHRLLADRIAAITPGSGLRISDRYAAYDAERKFGFAVTHSPARAAC